MADFSRTGSADRTSRSKQFGDKIDVPPDRQFSASTPIARRSTACGPATSPCDRLHRFRPTQLEYAVEKGIHVFMEKPFAPDPVGVRQVIQAGEAARRRTSRSRQG